MKIEGLHIVRDEWSCPIYEKLLEEEIRNRIYKK